MPIDPELLADSPYGPEGFLIDEVLEIDEGAGLVRVRMPTHAELPITRTQRAHPVRHPRHVAGGLMIHVTAIAAFIHAWYLLGMKHRDGWIGYGVRIHDARFHKLIEPGEPLEIVCRTVRHRRLGTRAMVRYAFTFVHDGVTVYESEQTAMWMRVPAE